MKKATNRLLLGLVGAFSAFGLILGGKAIVGGYKIEAVEVAAGTVSDTVTKSNFTSVNDDLNDFISYETGKGDGTTNPAINNGNIRLYQPASGKVNGGYITFTSLAGYTMNSISITTAQETTVNHYAGAFNNSDKTKGSSLAEDATLTVDNLATNEYTFVCQGSSSKNRLDIRAISITYSCEEAEPSKPVSIEQLNIAESASPVYQGMEFNPEGYGITVTFQYESGGSFQESYSLTDEEVEYTVSTANLGDTTLNVKFTSDDVTLSKDFTVTVVEAPAIMAMTDTFIYTDVEWASSGYTTFNNVVPSASETSVAYSGKLFKNGNNLQFNSSESRGFYSASSAGTIRSISVSWASGSKTLNVFTSETKPTSIGNFTKQVGTLTQSSTTFAFDENNNYRYFALIATGSLQVSKIDITWNVDTKEIDGFVTDFFDMELCGDGSGTTAPDTESWELLAYEFADLSDVHQAEIASSESDASDNLTVKGVVAKYDYIVGKYGTSVYKDFMGRNPASISGAYTVNHNGDDGSVYVVAGIAVSAVLAAGALIFLRKKQRA